ncbi:serine hydroxymethyltransferase, partial [Candidatus Geothermarchaeota archaeon]
MNIRRARKYYDKVFDLLQKHHEWFRQTIPLIASENITSPAVREAMITDLGHRYAEGTPGERVYAGCRYIDEIELITNEIAQKIFKGEFADSRPISGVNANLIAYTAFTQPGDVLFALKIPDGGHISMAPLRVGGTAGAVRGLDVKYFPFDPEEMNIDVEKTKKMVNELAKMGKPPKMVMFGASVFLFP